MFAPTELTVLLILRARHVPLTMLAHLALQKHVRPTITQPRIRIFARESDPVNTKTTQRRLVQATPSFGPQQATAFLQLILSGLFPIQE